MPGKILTMKILESFVAKASSESNQAIHGDKPVISARALTNIIIEMLLVREGKTITKAVAEERARNIATALIGLTIN